MARRAQGKLRCYPVQFRRPLRGASGRGGSGLGKESDACQHLSTFWALCCSPTRSRASPVSEAQLLHVDRFTSPFRPSITVMAPKSTAAAKQPTALAPSAASQTSPAAAGNAVQSLLKAYNETTSPRLKLIDAFLVFLMFSGVLQFVYCVLVTNFPFNAFLAGYVYHWIT